MSKFWRQERNGCECLLWFTSCASLMAWSLTCGMQSVSSILWKRELLETRIGPHTCFDAAQQQQGHEAANNKERLPFRQNAFRVWRGSHDPLRMVWKGVFNEQACGQMCATCHALPECRCKSWCATREQIPVEQDVY
eukprot:4100215-Amphidinium_carterae.2